MAYHGSCQVIRIVHQSQELDAEEDGIFVPETDMGTWDLGGRAGGSKALLFTFALEDFK